MFWLSTRKLFLLASAVPSFFYTPTVVQPQHAALLLAESVCVCVTSCNRTSGRV